MNNSPVQFGDIARLPLPGDNVAITTQRVDAGQTVQMDDQVITLQNSLLEAHRFAVRPIAKGEPLLSWELPFGVATRDIAPGEYVCNAGILEALAMRNLDFALPTTPNFVDQIAPYQLDESAFVPAEQVARHPEDRTFMGYRRSGNRGVGTRNYIVLLGTTSRTGSFVKQLEQRLANLAAEYPNVDGIVAIAHTEGGSGEPNNRELLLRTLAGFMVHPNVGAVLAVDYGVEPITNAMLADYLADNAYPLAETPHQFMSLTQGFLENLESAEHVVRAWLPQVNQDQRTPESLAHLKIALQCGGSDAFSGISGNPVAAWVAREVIRYGGAANLAETDELIGAEPYVLRKVRDLATAQTFLSTIERFKARVAWHGHTAEGNPSGGNKYRGLYNIVLKSIGAARKRDPEVRLDYVIDYSQPMTEPGYYFMDSPGNDLESVAGQVAAGCNLIFFVTGNGSITNFPFAPTIKIVTTSRRYRLLAREMDVNAGAYLDGTPMDELGAATLDLTVDVASGQATVGEKAGHAQTQIWRDWRQTGTESRTETGTGNGTANGTVNGHRQAAQGAASATIDGQSIPVLPVENDALATLANAFTYTARLHNGNKSAGNVGLILPTSLCAGQIARMIASKLNGGALVGQGDGQGDGQGVKQGALSHMVALVHTEGCGVSGGTSEELYIRTMLGYLAHPLVRHSLLLEHGCEKTHNDYMAAQMRAAGLTPDQFGWASIQLDGGIDQVAAKVEAWFEQATAEQDAQPTTQAGIADLRLGLSSDGPVSEMAATRLATLVRLIVRAGGTVVIPENATLLSTPAFRTQLLPAGRPPAPTLTYGQPLPRSGSHNSGLDISGLHIMEAPTVHWVETLTGLGATGVEVILALAGEHPLQSHPLVPVLQIGGNAEIDAQFQDDLDLSLAGPEAENLADVLNRIAATLSQSYIPKLTQLGNIDFQFTRGLMGVSM